MPRRAMGRLIVAWSGSAGLSRISRARYVIYGRVVCRSVARCGGAWARERGGWLSRDFISIPTPARFIAILFSRGRVGVYPAAFFQLKYYQGWNWLCLLYYTISRALPHRSMVVWSGAARLSTALLSFGVVARGSLKLPLTNLMNPKIYFVIIATSGVPVLMCTQVFETFPSCWPMRCWHVCQCGSTSTYNLLFKWTITILCSACRILILVASLLPRTREGWSGAHAQCCGSWDITMPRNKWNVSPYRSANLASYQISVHSPATLYLIFYLCLLLQTIKFCLT